MNLIERIRQLAKQPEAEKPPEPDGSEIGWENSILYSQKDFPKYNPDVLIGRKGPAIYREIMRDDQVKSVMLFKSHAVISRDWHFDVGTDDDGQERTDHKDMADFFDQVIKKIRGSFSQNLLGILTAMQHGFSITEKIYEPIQWQDKTMWGIKALKLRPYDSFNGGFEVDEHGNILALKQNQNGKMVEIPCHKVIHFVYQPDVDTHYGESDLRAAYRPWWSKDIAIKFQNIHLERHASGFVWAQIKRAITTGEKTNLKNLINNISARMGAILPEGVDLNHMQPMRTEAFEKAVAQHDKSIAKSILVPNLLGLSEQGQTGSYSQSQTQLEVFFWILDAIAAALEEELNEQLFLGLALWNFSTRDYPRFSFEPISEGQKEKIAKIWAELVSKRAVTPSDSDEAWIRKLIGAPEKTEPPAGGEEEPPDDLLPEEMPDNDDWIETQGEERAEMIRKEMAERPWLKRVDFGRLADALDSQDARFLDDLMNIMAKARLAIEKQIIKIVGERSLGNVGPKEIEAVKIPAGIVSRLRKLTRMHLQEILDEGYQMARKELPRKFARAIRPGMDKNQAEKFLARKAMKIAGVMEQDTVNAVQRVLENAIKYDKNLKQTIAAISDDTDLLRLLPETDFAGRPLNVPQRLENIARTNTADAVNQARQALFGEPEFKGFVLAYEYSAILDSRTSEICEHLDGRILKDFGVWTPPNHHMCRSILIPVTVVDDWDGKQSAKPRLQPQKGFA